MMTKKPSSEATKEAAGLKGAKQTQKPEHTTNASQCCMGSSSCTASNTSKQTTQSGSPYFGDSKRGPKTRITVKYDVGFNNSLYLRGKGANLSWDKGIPLKNLRPDEWVWETDLSFTNGEFKVLINDQHYENGDNHLLTCGANIHYTPYFDA